MLPFAALQFAVDQVRKLTLIHVIVTQHSNGNALHILAFVLQKLAIRCLKKFRADAIADDCEFRANGLVGDNQYQPEPEIDSATA